MKHPVDTSQWGEFVTKDLFGPSQLGKYHNPKNLQESETGYPYICASNLNNGINTSMPYVTGDDLKPTPTNIISWGKQCPYFTYHDTPCITSQGMYYINVADYSKLQIDFIITVLTALTREYNYTNCLIGKIFDELVLKLPLKPSTDPSNCTQEDIDWTYMETVMSRVTARAKDRLASLPQPTDKKKTPVDTSAWGEFVVGELFETNGNKTYTGAGIPKNNLEAGSTPRITVTDKNNGIIGYFNDTDNANYRVYENFISVSFLGTVFWHPYKASVDMKVHVLNKPKGTELNEERALFLVACIKKTIATFSYAEQLSASKLYDLTIKLPLKPSADPKNYTQEDIDWDYMDSFMQAIEEKAHERVASLRKQI